MKKLLSYNIKVLYEYFYANEKPLSLSKCDL